MAEAFLRRHGMHPEQTDLLVLCENFFSEMTNGLEGAPSNLLMLPTYLSCEARQAQDSVAAVIDAGGTHARVARVRFYGHSEIPGPKTPLLEQLETFPMPGSQGQVSREAFFEAFAEKLVPLLPDCDALGFCFSFPCEILPTRDGRVLYFDKEVQVADSQGMHLLELLGESLRRRGIDPPPGVVLNDTAAALLGGAAQTDPEQWDGFLGLIWGTGLNVCYSEPVEQISKLKTVGSGSMLINTESGIFSNVPTGDFDRELDAGSSMPGSHLYEKMVSGAYLGQVIGRTLSGAARECRLPDRFSELQDLTTAEADAFLVEPTGKNRLATLCQTEDERAFVQTVAELLCLRAARLVSANLGAALLRADLGRDPDHPACIVAEGSTLYKSKLLLPYLESTLTDFVVNRLGRHFRLLKPEHANLVGSAAAALWNC